MTRIDQLNRTGTAGYMPTPKRWRQTAAFGLVLLKGVLLGGAAALAGVQEVRVVRVVDGDTVLVADAQSLQAQAKYAHSYYWAPFILMGNWKRGGACV